MTVTGRLETVAFDAADIEALSSYYAELAGWTITRTEDDWIVSQLTDGREVSFQRAPDHVAPQWPGQEHPQQFHLDLLVTDHQAAAERAVALGGTKLADGATWITVADPAGHPFDLCQKDGFDAAMGLYAITIDAPDASGLAKFYGQLMGMEVAYDGPEGALISKGNDNVMFQQISDYTAPDWPNPARPQQAHLDILFDDLDAGEAHVLELGAKKLPSQERPSFRVFADPAGHPFCITQA